MMQGIAVVIGSLVALVAVLSAGFTMGFRTRYQPLLRVVRRFNRDVTNKRQLQGPAGQPGAYASVVHHVGRRSGSPYRTPVVAVPADDGFLFALPYGPDADWVRNVLAAGGATIEHEGETVAVTDPRLVTADDANSHFAAAEQRMHRLFGVTDFLAVRLDSQDRSAEPAPSAGTG